MNLFFLEGSAPSLPHLVDPGTDGAVPSKPLPRFMVPTRVRISRRKLSLKDATVPRPGRGENRMDDS
jgi:hypothetical protein